MAKGQIPLFGGLAPDQRPICETPLRSWLDKYRMTQMEFARQVGVDPKMVGWWVRGQCLPGLINAFRIELVTQGGVPASTWLATERGRLEWDHRGRDFDKFDEMRAAMKARQKAAQAAEATK